MTDADGWGRMMTEDEEWWRNVQAFNKKHHRFDMEDLLPSSRKFEKFWYFSIKFNKKWYFARHNGPQPSCDHLGALLERIWGHLGGSWGLLGGLLGVILGGHFLLFLGFLSEKASRAQKWAKNDPQKPPQEAPQRARNSPQEGSKRAPRGSQEGWGLLWRKKYF